MVEYPASLPFAFPPHTRHVLDAASVGTSVSHCWLQFGSQRCSTWFLAVGTGDREELRRLRIHLLRLHAERECLKLVLLRVNDGKLDLGKDASRSDAVQQYLNDALKAIEKPQRYGLAQSAMLDAARQALGIALEGQEASLQLMRRQVAAKVKGYIQREQNTATVINNVYGDQMNTNIQLGDVNVQGDFNLVTAKNIQNSFNKAGSADVGAELKDKLKALAVEVARLAKQLPPEQAEAVSKDLETLTTEAVSKKPRKEWYELSAKGLLEAAKTVAELAAPVTTAVKAVLALLV